MNISIKMTGLAMVLMVLSLSLKSQQQKISIEPQTLVVKDILKQLSEKGSISFSYIGLEQGLAMKITLSPANGSVSEILEQVGKHTGWTFQRSGNTIAIKSANGTIKGIVLDHQQQPVAGATVSLQNEKKSVATDERGQFSFYRIRSGKYTVQISHVHHATLKQAVYVTDEEVVIAKFMLSPKSESDNTLNPVVVTGQFRPQSLNKSIYRVEVIDKKQIQNMAVSNIAELLKQQLNIEIENQSGMGRAKIRVLGLNSQYVKILMDNIPVAGDENMGSDVDLSTISLDDVERVEIVKGAMGVEYGANSIAGVINIITKKNARNKTDISLEIQEESIRNEYNLFFDKRAKGRHIQRISASHKLMDNVSIGGSMSRDQFNGYWNDYTGVGVMTETIGQYPYLKRGYDWSPKESWNGNAFISRTGKKLNLFYKFNYFSSNLTNYTHQAEGFMLPDEQVIINASSNNDYRTQRYNHHLNARGDFWKNAYYSLDLSLQKNGLEHRRQGINLWDNSVLDKGYGIPGSQRLQATDWEKHFQSKGFYAKGTLLKPIIPEKLDYNIGFEMDNTKGNQGYTSWFNDVSLSTPIEQTLFTGAAYTAAEWQVSKKIMIRPGFRVNYSNKLKMRTNESITTRFRINEKNDLRLIIGTSTRFPNYEEIYSWYVNSVHDYRGNPDLKPEYGKSVELQWSFKKELNAKMQLESNVSSMFQHIRDRIVSVTYFVPGQPQITGRNTYDNENKYNGLLNQVNLNLVTDKFNIAIAGSLLGYRGDDDASVKEYRKFLLNTQANAQLAYVLPLDIRVALFYRFVGKQPLYVFVPKPYTGTAPTEFHKILNETDAYHNLDFNIARSFFSKKLDLRVGVRNLFDVTDIKYNPVNKPDNVTVSNTRIMRLYYGRSYFMKLSYNIFN